MKKFLLIAIAAAAMLFVAAPNSKAGVSVAIGVGFPAYPAYAAYYPYGYYPYPVVRPVYVGYYRPWYWWHGRRCYYYGRRWR